MHFSAKCNSGRIAIHWFHIKHYLDYQYTKFQPYTFRVQKMCVFARYAILVPRLIEKRHNIVFADFSEVCSGIVILGLVLSLVFAQKGRSTDFKPSSMYT